MGPRTRTFTDEDFIRHDPFWGDESTVECRQVRIVTTRKPQKCMNPNNGKLHDIPPGTRCRFEKALIEGIYWSRYYVCIECLERWIREQWE